MSTDHNYVLGQTERAARRLELQDVHFAAPSEAIPYPDGRFDIVTTFNSLDHVDDPRRTVAGIIGSSPINPKVKS